MCRLTIINEGKDKITNPLVSKGFQALNQIKDLMKKIDLIVKEANQNQCTSSNHGGIHLQVFIDHLFKEILPEIPLHLREGRPLQSISEYIGKITVQF